MPVRKVLSFSTYSKIQHKSPSSFARYTWKQRLKVEANKAVPNQALSKHGSALSNTKGYIPGHSPPDLLSTQPWCLLESRFTLWSLDSHLPALHKWGKPPGHSSCGGPWLLSSWEDQWLTMKAAACQLSFPRANTVQEKPESPMAFWGRRHKHIGVNSFLSLPHLTKELRAAYSSSHESI